MRLWVLVPVVTYYARGYIVENVVWCRWEINRMKNDLTADEFVDFCSIVSRRLG